MAAGAIGYARVSTDEQMRENNSLPVQKQKIAAYCDQQNVPLLKVFEASESARTMDRPGLQKLIAHCREHRGKISLFVVSDYSRLARNVQDQGQIIVILKQLGIDTVSIDEPLGDDSAMGQFVRNMFGSVNQLFSDALSERTRYRMQEAAKAGRFVWHAPIGYLNKNKSLQIDPERAPLVREAFQLFASGRFVTTDAVRKLINVMGLRTTKGNPVSKQTFSRMLSNEVYCGWVVSGDIRARGNHEPIISQELFDAVQTRLKGKGAPHKQLHEDFPLRGVIRCAKCGKLLTGGWVKGRSDRYARYWCWTAGCRAIGISRDDLERRFVGLLSLMEPTAELLAQLPGKIAAQWRTRNERIAADARRLTARLAEQAALNQKAIVAKLKNEISAEDFAAFKQSIAEEKVCLDAALNDLESERCTMEEMLKQAQVHAVDLVGAWQRGNVNQRQELANAFFPEGLVFSHESGFVEPANTVITEMVMRFLNDMGEVGAPNGI